MIHFQLKCSKGHEFEAWFRSSKSFADQRKCGDIHCPVCGDTQVTKALMTPSIAKGGRISGGSDEKSTGSRRASTKRKFRNYIKLLKTTLNMLVMILPKKRVLFIMGRQLRETYMVRLQKKRFKNLMRKELILPAYQNFLVLLVGRIDIGY